MAVSGGEAICGCASRDAPEPRARGPRQENRQKIEEGDQGPTSSEREPEGASEEQSFFSSRPSLARPMTAASCRNNRTLGC